MSGPHIVSAASRLLIEIAGWVVASTAVGLLSHGVAFCLSPDSPRQRILQWVFWWYFLVTFTVWAAGTVGMLRPGWILGTLVFALVVLLRRDRHLAGRAWGDIVGMVRSLGAALKSRPVACSGILVVWTVILARQFIHVWILPPLVYDVLTYHLPKVADWVREGRLVAAATPVVRSYWPANFELSQTWFVLFWKQDVIVECAGLICYALAAGSVYCIVRSLGVSRMVAAWAATAYATSPAVLLSAVGANNDIAVAGCFLFIVAMLLEWRDLSPAYGPCMCILVCAAGIGIGTKPYLVFMLPALLLLMPVCWPIMRRGRDAPRKASGSLVIGLMLAGIALAAYWYIRNLCLFANPVYPADLRLFGRLIAGDGHGSMWQQGVFSLGSLAGSATDLVTRRVFDDAGPCFTPDLGNMTGWGWFVFCAALPAVIIELPRRRQLVWCLLAFLAAAALVLAFVATDPWNMRYLLWVPAVFAVGWAFLIEDFHGSAVRLAAMAFAVMCLSMNVVATLNNGWTTPEDWRYFRKIPVTARVARTCFDGIGRVVPPGATIAYFLGPNDPVYVLYASDMTRRIQWLHLSKPGDSFYQAMLAAGCTYLAVDADQTADRVWYEPFHRELQRGLFKPLGSQCYEVVR